MSRDFPKHQDMSYLSVYYQVWIDGKPLSSFETTLIEQIEYEDTSTGSDMVSITFYDPDYTVIGNPKIVRSTPCKVEAGFMNKYRIWIDGYISAVDVEFPQEGTPTMIVHVMDKSYIMNRVEKKRTFKNLSYTGVAKKIAQSYGFSFEGDVSGEGGKKEESVSQSYETDIQFLTGLASEIGYVVFLDGSNNTLYFKDKETYTKSPSFDKLWYRNPPFDILSFKPRVIQADQLDEVEESDIDNKSKKESSAKVTNTTDPNNTSGSSESQNLTNEESSSEDDSGPIMYHDPYTDKWVKG